MNISFHITNYVPISQKICTLPHAQITSNANPKICIYPNKRNPNSKIVFHHPSSISLSNPRIILQISLTRRIRIPSLTNILKSLRIRHTDRNIALALHELHSETLGCVPRNVAMQEPGARVVFLEGDGEVAVRGQGSDVSARWVDEV